MTQITSTATNRPFATAQVCRVWKVPRSTLYTHREKQEVDRPAARRRGPTGPCPDDELLERIRAVMKASPFQGEWTRSWTASPVPMPISGRNRWSRPWIKGRSSCSVGG